MANIIGTITINETKFVELDGNPLISPTLGLEIGDFCIINNVPGVWHKVGSGDYDISRVDLLSSQSTQATANGILTLANYSSNIQVFNGTTAGQIVDLPDATTLPQSFRYEFWNTSTQSISIRDFGSNVIITVGPGELAFLVLNSNISANGVWNKISITPPTGVSYGSPVTIGTANNAGSVSPVARADHVHDHGAQSTGTHHAVATPSLNGFMSTTDKTKLNSLVTKSAVIVTASFTGNPKKATVTFTAPFASTSYNTVVTGVDGRFWTIESKLAGSFVINTNANAALTGDVYWQAQLNGEVG